MTGTLALNNMSFMELSKDEMMVIDGGSFLGYALSQVGYAVAGVCVAVAAVAVVSACVATSPVWASACIITAAAYSGYALTSAGLGYAASQKL